MYCLTSYDELLDYLEIEDFEGVTLFVEYTNSEGYTNSFRITDVSESAEYGELYIDAYCIDKDGEYEGMSRTFKIKRFDHIEVQT